MLHTLPEIEQLIDRAIQEDLSLGDPTTEALIPNDLQGSAVILSRVPGVVAGVPIAMAVFRRVEPSLKAAALLEDGSSLEPGSLIARITGPFAGILRAERTALNFLQRLSGIATETARYVAAVQGLPVRITDTRKTTPALRLLEKHAVRVGGGHSHRRNLGDGILIKDNHIAALRRQGASLQEIVEKAKERASHTVRIEVEVETVEEAAEALRGQADILLLDNMGLEEMRRAVEMVGGRALTEASGGITLDTVRAVAETGVDLISIGALTHSVRALDLSLEAEWYDGTEPIQNPGA